MSEQKSKYAQKRSSGNQMYGPGCCGHLKSPRHMQEAVDLLLRARRRQ